MNVYEHQKRYVLYIYTHILYTYIYIYSCEQGEAHVLICAKLRAAVEFSNLYMKTSESKDKCLQHITNKPIDALIHPPSKHDE